jgi:hypothetical protein
MAGTELGSDTHVGDVMEIGPIGSLPRKPEHLADGSPVALAIHQIGVGQRSVNVEHD